MSLRIMHVLASPHLGGAEQVCLWLARAQLDRGHDVKLFVLARGRPSDVATETAIPTVLADLPHAAIVGKRVFRRKAAESFRRAVTEFKPMLVHSHVPLTNLLSNRVLPRLGVPWITTVHGSWRQFGYAPVTMRKPYLRPYLLLRHAIGDFVTTRSATRIVAVSQYVRRELQSIGVPDRRIRTVLNGLPDCGAVMSRREARQAMGIPDDVLVIGAMGYFAPVKGFDILIQAVATLQSKYPNLHLWIAGGDVIGDTSVRRSLEKLISDLCPGGRARLLVSLNNKADFLSSLDIFAVSSRTESFHLGLAEAMRASVPSVVTSAGGCVEIARPGMEGLVFESGNPKSLAARLETLVLDPQLREALGGAARERALSSLTLKRCAEEYEEVYREVIEHQTT